MKNYVEINREFLNRLADLMPSYILFLMLRIGCLLILRTVSTKCRNILATASYSH